MMKFFVLRRWKERSKRQKLGIGFTGVILILLLGFALWLVWGSDTPSGFSVKDSLPVNASVGDPSIEFSTELVKPLPKGEDYFVNYRLQREQSRQEAKWMLSPLLNSTVTKTKEEAQQKWLALSHKIEKEGQIENLLLIKGFQDVVVDVSQSGVNVIVYAQNLSSDQVHLIQDIVVRITGVRVNQINISFKK
jgi:stage III sporulation protein AH